MVVVRIWNYPHGDPRGAEELGRIEILPDSATFSARAEVADYLVSLFDKQALVKVPPAPSHKFKLEKFTRKDATVFRLVLAALLNALGK